MSFLHHFGCGSSSGSFSPQLPAGLTQRGRCRLSHSHAERGQGGAGGPEAPPWDLSPSKGLAQLRDAVTGTPKNGGTQREKGRGFIGSRGSDHPPPPLNQPRSAGLRHPPVNKPPRTRGRAHPSLIPNASRRRKGVRWGSSPFLPTGDPQSLLTAAEPADFLGAG